ncbi:MAG: ABC transporter substrate-binding protein [Alphaproteobacteria bacterium]|nr:ABC transporter substrate-binding protein [Alphaproteobacteria bacterium]
MKKILIIIGIVVIIAAAFFVFRPSRESADSRPVVKIGVSLPLSGNMSYVGVPTKAAAQMALEKWQAQGTKFQYKLVFEDDGYDIKKIAMIGNKFVNMDKVNAIVGIWNLTNYQIRELAPKANIPFMSCGWGHGTSDGVLVFNNQTPHDEHARAFTEIVQGKLKAKTIAYAGQISNGDLALKEDILNAFRKAGIKIVFEESINYGTTDNRITIQKIKQANPEVIVIPMAPTELQIFTKQLFEAGIKTPLVTVDYFESVTDPTVFDGMYMVMSSSGTPEFRKQLNEYTGRPWANSDCIAPVYDNVDILIYAFENAAAGPGQIPTTEQVVKVIRGIKNWYGAMMENMDVRPDGRIWSPARVSIMKNGKAEVVK